LENQKTSRVLRIPARAVEDEYHVLAPGLSHHTLIERLELLTNTVSNLSDTIARQNEKFDNVQSELREIKDQNEVLREELQCLQTKLENSPNAPASSISWATVAARANTNGVQATPQTDADRARKREVNCLRISTDPCNEESEPDAQRFARYLPTREANAHIRNALQKTEALRHVQVDGVGTTKTGYVIRFKDIRSKEAAAQNSDWLGELGNGTKVVKPRYGVVVHRMPTESLNLTEKKKEAVQLIMEENEMTARGYNVNDVVWLQRKDKTLGASASLGIWFDTPEAAE